MKLPFSLPLLGGSVLAAAALGLHLGESAIGMIDPIYFQGPALHPRDRGAAIDEDELLARSQARPSYASLYGWDEGLAARPADCVECEALRARDAHAYSAEVPYFGGPSEPPPAEVEPEPVVYRPPPPATTPPPKPGMARYAHYPVNGDEAALSAIQVETDETAVLADVQEAVAEYGDAAYQRGDVWLPEPRDPPRRYR